MGESKKNLFEYGQEETALIQVIKINFKINIMAKIAK
jgi:hypothetical protein